MDLSRRKFFLGAAASLIAAPAIVRVASLMAVKPVPEYPWVPMTGDFVWTDPENGFSEIVTEMLRNRKPHMSDLIVKNNALIAMLKDRRRVVEETLKVKYEVNLYG